MKRTKTFLTSYGWLILALFFLFLAGGDQPVGLAIWLAPFFMLRFFHEVKLWKAALISLPTVAAVILIADHGMMPFPLSIAIILTAINTAIALVPYIIDRIVRQSLPLSVRTLLFPFLAVSAEVFLASHFTGGTWGNPAYGIENLTLLQMVSVTGIWGVMFLIYWAASVMNEIWENRSQLRSIRKLIAAFIIVLIAVHGFGMYRLRQDKPREQIVQVAGITPGPEYREEMMEIFGKIFSSQRTGVFDDADIRASIQRNFNALLSKSNTIALSGIDLIAWSEGASFIFKSDEKRSIQQASQLAIDHQIYLCLGLAVLDDSCQSLLSQNLPFLENKLVLIAPDGTIAFEYLKGNLAPGYERAMTIPGDRRLKLADTDKGRITGVICYDMDFPSYIRQSASLKSDLLLAPSNDWPEIVNTHAKMARLRAIENGVSLLRPTSSGMSIAVDPYGRIVSCVDDFQSAGAPLVAVLPMQSVKTLYASMGDILTWICAISGIALFVMGVISRIRK